MTDDTGINNTNSDEGDDEAGGDLVGVGGDISGGGQGNKPQTPENDDFPEPGAIVRRVAGDEAEESEPMPTPGTDADTGRPDPYAHLRKHQFRPGQSGNPAGRPPKDRSMRERLRQLIRADAGKFDFARDLMERLVKGQGEVDDQAISNMDIGDVLLLVSVFKASRGDAKHMSMILERTDGKIVGAFNDQKPEAVDTTAKLDIDIERRTSINFYRAILDDPEVTTREKMDARRELNILLGLTKDTDVREASDLAEKTMAAISAMMQSSSDPEAVTAESAT